jgi:hypothetical protein
LADFFSSVFTIENDNDETLLENIQYDEHSNNDNFTLTEVNKLLKELLRFLKSAVIWPILHPSGTVPVLKELLNIVQSGLSIMFVNSYKTLG